MLTMLPTPDEIFNAVSSLKKESAPGPDGFGANFYQTYWSIVKQDVINAVLEFFSKDWLHPNYNSNTLVLIPKVPDAMSVSQYRPITLANFRFKIVSKILADRLAPIMIHIISLNKEVSFKAGILEIAFVLPQKRSIIFITNHLQVILLLKLISPKLLTPLNGGSF